MDRSQHDVDPTLRSYIFFLHLYDSRGSFVHEQAMSGQVPLLKLSTRGNGLISITT